MKPRTTTEPLSFALTLLAAVGTVACALRFPREEDAHSGPGSFPVFLGVVLIGLALCGLVQSIRKKTIKQDADNPPTERMRMLQLGGAIALYLLLMPHLGFITATALLCAGVLMILGYRNPARALAAGFIAAFTLYGIFGVLMKVILPKGWIG